VSAVGPAGGKNLKTGRTKTKALGSTVRKRPYSDLAKRDRGIGTGELSTAETASIVSARKTV